MCNRWSAGQIRNTRQTLLKPLLEQMGYRLLPLADSNWQVHGLPKDIIIKETFWVCPDTGAGGNAIDLLVQVMGMSFSEAMQKLEAVM